MEVPEKNEVIKLLKQAYSEKNLNMLTSRIILQYKNRNFGYIQEINSILCNNQAEEKEKINKIFSRVIMHFHPDKNQHYQNEIDLLNRNKDYQKLDMLSKIFQVMEIDELAPGRNRIDPDFSFEAEYVWDYDQEGFSYFTESEEELFDINPENEGFEEYRISFLSALKRREYGTIKIDFPVHQLYDAEEIELADYDIEDLEGIEFCRNLVKLDLSDNRLIDISALAVLSTLEELYISNNLVESIDRIYTLKQLRILDISGNDISDISVLQRLNKLEYINITGNQVPRNQVDALKEQGVIVIY